jgi:hypothetical protein
MSKFAILIISLIGTSIFCQSAAAGTLYNISLDTSPLVGHPAGPFYLYLEVVDGSGVGDGNNSASLADFNFGGGSEVGSPFSFGGATGSLGSKLTLTDTSDVNFFTQQFTPGKSLSFSISLTTNDDVAEYLTGSHYIFWIVRSCRFRR